MDAYGERRMDETPLVARALAGDEAAVAALYDRYADKLYDYARFLTGSSTDAGDITHDVFLVLVDSGFAFLDRGVSAGWITVRDVEHGGTRVVSRRAFRALAEQARAWQQEVVRLARAADLDVVVLGADEAQGEIALAEFVAERRLRKVAR